MGFIDGYEWIELTPKDLEAQYKSIKMGFDNDKLGMMIIIDNLEQISRIDFSDLKKNIPLPSNIFNFDIPDTVKITVEKQTIIKISGSDKQEVGMIASKIKSLRPPEPYKGKGIKEQGQYILKKEGKKK